MARISQKMNPCDAFLRFFAGWLWNTVIKCGGVVLSGWLHPNRTGLHQEINLITGYPKEAHPDGIYSISMQVI